MPSMSSLFPADLTAHAARLLDALRARSLTLATAESCTGGLIAGLLTEIAGASDVVDSGFVTYSNDAKTEALGVHPDLIARHGAVSREVARAMAEGALIHSGADVAIAVTGIAGPGGGTDLKPVGLVHLAVARIGRDTRNAEARFGDIGRSGVRLATVARALDLIDTALRHENDPCPPE